MTGVGVQRWGDAASSAPPARASIELPGAGWRSVLTQPLNGVEVRRGAPLHHDVYPMSVLAATEFRFMPVQNKTFPLRMSPIATIERDGVYANRWELTEHVLVAVWNNRPAVVSVG